MAGFIYRHKDHAARGPSSAKRKWQGVHPLIIFTVNTTVCELLIEIVLDVQRTMLVKVTIMLKFEHHKAWTVARL